MEQNSQAISCRSINKYAKNTYSNIKVFKTVDSTNTVASLAAENGAEEWTVIIAEEQISGKGRMNRQFYSPLGTGLYMSIVLRPKLSAESSVFITAAAAVAAAEAIEAVSDQRAEIKWVNDIYCNGKKVCGILTQGAVNAQSGKLDYAILGIGINVFAPQNGFPDSIESIAGSVLEYSKRSCETMSRIIAEILDRFAEYYKSIENKTFLAEYRTRSFVTGKKINVIKQDDIRPAEAIAIDDNCGLRVRYADGTTETLISGEVSTRLSEG